MRVPDYASPVLGKAASINARFVMMALLWRCYTLTELAVGLEKEIQP